MLLSAVLFGVTVLVARAVFSRFNAVASVGVAVLLFIAFVWLSPQIYYQFYRMILEGLPQQRVVKDLPDIVHAIRLLGFQDQANLSFHAQGILGWVLIGMAIGGRARRKSP